MAQFDPLDIRDFIAPDRRDLLRALGLGAGFFLSEMAMSRHVLAKPVFKADPFSLGVASGDPAADGFVIWTRLAPEPLAKGGGMPSQAVEVAWELAEDEGFTRRVRAGKSVAKPGLGHSVHVEVAGLQPGRDYFYRFEAGGVRSPQGRARTMPAPDATGTIRFASAGCQRYEEGLFTAWRRIAEDRLDFVIHYGDYIYEYKAPKRETEPRGATPVRHMPGDPDKCLTLDDFRNRYAIYKLDPDLQAAHASTPFITSFDDHEVENNWAGYVSNYKGVSPEAFRLRRQAAFQAWYEHMPLRAAQRPRGPEILAYRRLRAGALLQIDSLDTRQYRDVMPCEGGWKTCPDAAAETRTMLGKAQESWLEAGFKTSRARWNVIAQQVPMGRFDRNPDPAITETHMDKWDGAEAARRRLLEATIAAKLPNVVVIAGDVHHNRAGNLVLDFNDASAKPVAAEFVATSISSGGDGTDKARAHGQILSANPHLKLYNSQRGYVRHTVSEARWQAEYQVADKVTAAGGTMTTRARFVVENGRPGTVEA